MAVMALRREEGDGAHSIIYVYVPDSAWRGEDQTLRIDRVEHQPPSEDA